MRRDRHRLRHRHRGDVHQGRNPAAVAHVRVQDVGGAAFQAVEERLPGIHRLAGDDRHRQRAPHLRHQFDVVAQAGFLVPADIEFGEAPAQPDRVHRRQAPVHLHQQPEFGTQRVAHGAHVADHMVLVLAMDEAAPGAGERVPFQRAVAGFLHGQRPLHIGFDQLGPARPAVRIHLHRRARRPAEQVVERHPRLLGDDIPQRDLDRAPGRAKFEGCPPHREILEDHLRGVADGERAAADHHAGHGGQDIGNRLLLARGHVGLTPAVQAALGLHAAEQQVLRRARVEQERFDARDLHGRLPPQPGHDAAPRRRCLSAALSIRPVRRGRGRRGPRSRSPPDWR